MRNGLSTLFLSLLLCAAGWNSTVLAQDPVDDDGSSEQVEESDESYRRRMELEDARQRDPLSMPPTSAQKSTQEKLDKLPSESRDNIREQLVDVIIENGEWEPFDALREYPYTPTAAAEGDPALLQREQDAWDEQVEKYHEREAQAYGATRGPVAGPGNPTGEDGGGQTGAEGQAGQEGQPSTEQAGANGEQGESGADSSSAAQGTFQPYEPNRGPSEEAVSTAGAQQSALDFLRGQQQAPSAAPDASASTQPSASIPVTAAPASVEAAADASETEDASASETAAETEPELDLDTPGIIAIEDLDKLEGTRPSEDDEVPR